MKKSLLPTSIVVLGIMIAFGVVLGQGITAQGFGFEKNTQVRKSADAESVTECIQSCEEMLAGWLEMNPDSKNYDLQSDKIEAKSEQCLAMNELAGFPVAKQVILASCGQQSSCVAPVDCVFRNLSGKEIAALPACTNVPPCDADPFDPNIFGVDEQGNLCDPEKQCDGSTPECVEIPLGIPINEGACGSLSFIETEDLPQCCTEEKPEIDCGLGAEWVVGFAIFPGCFILDS